MFSLCKGVTLPAARWLTSLQPSLALQATFADRSISDDTDPAGDAGDAGAAQDDVPDQRSRPDARASESTASADDGNTGKSTFVYPSFNISFDPDTAPNVPGPASRRRAPLGSDLGDDQTPSTSDASGSVSSRGHAPVGSAARGDSAPVRAPPQLHQFRQPAQLMDIPENVRPHFRKIERKRPPPTSLDAVWQALRDTDKCSERARRNGFRPAVDVSVSLFIDPRRADQLVRGTVSLPHGTGRHRRIVAFAEGPDVDAALAAGATEAGGQELIDRIATEKKLLADAVAATPEMMPKMGKVARILGPKGLMPNPKMGNIASDIGAAVTELLRGKVQFRNDKGGTVSACIGRVDFPDAHLMDNFYAFFNVVMNLRPKGVKGSDTQGYVERVSLSTTQGKGYPVRFDDLSAAARERSAPLSSSSP